MADDSGGVVALIWANLVGRFDELKEINNWFDHVPRLCVVGRPDAAPRSLFETLFGQPSASAAHGEGDAAWEVYASFTYEELPGGGFVGALGPEETALTYLRETDAVLLALPAEQLPGPHERALFDHVKRIRRTRLAVVHTPLGEGERPPRRVERLDRKAWTEWVLEVRRAFDQYDLAVLPVRRQASGELVAVSRQLHDALDARLRLMFIGKLEHSRCRDALVNKVILDYGKSAAFLGASPIPYADAVALTPLQVLLVIRVAGAYGKRVKPGWAKEFVSTVAGVA
ncbi:MAG: hypothetical protein HYU66_17740, partial [Armatimonadetes bacterium]|nr:hypothetical protein [Armatimonadota bacterium]